MAGGAGAAGFSGALPARPIGLPGFPPPGAQYPPAAFGQPPAFGTPPPFNQPPTFGTPPGFGPSPPVYVPPGPGAQVPAAPPPRPIPPAAPSPGPRPIPISEPPAAAAPPKTAGSKNSATAGPRDGGEPSATKSPAQRKPSPPSDPPRRPIPLTPEQIAAAAQPRVQTSTEEEVETAAQVLRRNAAPLGVSFVVHLVLMIVLGLLTHTKRDRRPVMLESSGREAAAPNLAELRGFAAIDPVQVSDFRPLASVPLVRPRVNVPISPFGVGNVNPLAAVDTNAPAALAGRGVNRSGMVGKFGGTDLTEEAVELGLDWLARKQLSNGLWCLSGKEGPVKSQYSRGASEATENREAATAMALLAFLGAGQTHRAGKHAQVIDNGVKALLRSQDAEGSFFKGKAPEDWLYTQAQCTMALCELLALTDDTALRAPCEKAVKFCVEAQAAEGGWRYRPRQDSDTSVTGWMLMALQSAKNAKLRVPQETFDNVGKYLDLAGKVPAGADARRVVVTKELEQRDRLQAEVGSKYAYMPGDDLDNPVMTAEGLLCRLYLGWNNADPRLESGCRWLLENHPPQWAVRDVYYWYYATQTMFHMEGDYWKRWNGMLRDQLVQHQEKTGGERGSWDPLCKDYDSAAASKDGADMWSMTGRGGRLYVTCFSIYMLEVYYRHLPLYSEMKQQLEAKRK